MTDHYQHPDQVEEAFYAAFARLDADAIGALLSNAQASCIHPGGPLLEGKDAVLQSWREIFTSARPPTMAHRTLQRLEDGALAVHLVEERIRPSGEASTKAALVFATNVYVRDNGGWRLARHHASLPLMGRADHHTGHAVH